MKTSKLLCLTAVAFAATATLAACGSKNNSNSDGKKSDFTVALITDTGGVDDKSFNQSAWEGLQEWGQKEGLTKGVGGFTYFQSGSESDYQTNINQAISQKFSLVYGIGFALQSAISDAADRNKDTKFVIVDDVIEGKENVASVTFADQEGAYLAGVAAAKTTKTKKVGFVGGAEGDVIGRFEAGFVAGVKSVDATIKVTVSYAGGFDKPDKGKSITATMIADGVDVIYQAAGGTGAGVFSEVKATNESKASDAADKVWIIGVDRDQKGEGDYTAKDGETANCVLVSTVKAVGVTVGKINDLAKDGKFPGGEHLTYGLVDGGVKLVNDNASDEVMDAVKKAEEAIKDKTVDVPDKP